MRGGKALILKVNYVKKLTQKGFSIPQMEKQPHYISDIKHTTKKQTKNKKTQTTTTTKNS